ncbi:hypothetical protein GGH96_001443 [Coemansia sp. RSA 1972]|nr:hypothetical protein GGH96_001443 [Coemansia sp. RSA 1972]
MGISAIFKRSKASGSSDSGSEAQKARHIKQNQNVSAPVADRNAGAKDRRLASVDHPARARKATGRYAPAPDSLSSSDVDLLPTPGNSIDEGTYGRHSQKTNAKAKVIQRPPPVNTQRPRQGALDDSVLGLHSLKTPPLDVPLPRHKELDPFDSPPPRPLSDFEDPVYIPPLTLAATLFDDYGTAGSVPAASGSASATGARSKTASAPKAAAGSGSLDLLSEFNATYSYLFGSPPVDSTPSSDNMAARTTGTKTSSGLLSPASTEPSKTPSPVNEEASDDEQSSAGSASTSSSNRTAEDPELEEERRREEERKAAEQRNRRREMIKQQVAFERMKERHRRQCPGQPAGPVGNIARWQKDAAGVAMPGHGYPVPGHGQAMQPSASQNPMFASSATINRGFAQASPPQQSNRLNASFYSNISANASMPNIAQSPDALHMHMQRSQQLPLMVDTAAARATTGVSYPYSAPVMGMQPLQLNSGIHSAPVSGMGPTAVGFQSPTQLCAHPVKLASIPHSSKNPYLSDSSGDDASDSSSAGDSIDTSSTTSSDASYSSFKPPSNAGATDLAVEDATVHMARRASQPAILSRRDFVVHRGSNDSSSEESAKSQSSSKRRVRFHETVSVVFNTRHSTTEEGGNCSSDSDNDSSNASLDLSDVRGSNGSKVNQDKARVSTGATEYAADDAFDDAGACGSLRYQIPAIALMRWSDNDTFTTANSKLSSETSSRNISPDGAKGRKQRPKHRIETQPLRDREAEREQKRKDTAVSSAPAPAPAPDRANRTQSQDEARTYSGEAGVSSDVDTNNSAAGEEKQRLDPMTEARRALLGHYNVPTPMTTIGNGIPRSNSVSGVTRTSSVKVIGPQSFARPKNRFSASNSNNTGCNNGGNGNRNNSSTGQTKGSWESYKCKQRGSASNSSQTATENRQTGSNEDQSGKASTGSGTARSSLDKNSATQQSSSSGLSSVGRKESDEFNFNNVLQSFELSSFELTKSKEGGMFIRYSDKDQTSKDEAKAADDSSDEDDIPLSAIARSRSEPGSNMHRQAMMRQSQEQGSDSKTSADKRRGAGKQESRKHVLVRNSSVGHNVRQPTMTASTSAPSSAPTSSSKRRFSKWGSIF